MDRVAELRAAVQEASNRVVQLECNLNCIDLGESVETELDADLKESYAKLVSLLRSEPIHLASLAHAISLNEMNASLESSILTIFGNQFNRREEWLLLSLLQRIISMQFDKASNFGSVMRANTPASRMLSTYTRRRAGTQYLRHTLSMLMTHVTELGDTCLEINAFKLDSQHPPMNRNSFSSTRIDSAHSESFLVSPIRSVFSSVPRKFSMPVLKKSLGQVVEERVQLLVQLVGRFLDTLVESIERVPFEIRWLCKQIWTTAKAKFPQESESNFASLVGGFFLLRYINPAIVSPESVFQPSELDPLVQSPNGKRTLTLVAKTLQMIANKPSAVKEPYMAPLIPLIQEHKIRIVQFFSELCKVEDFEFLGTGELDFEDDCDVEDCFAGFEDLDAADLYIRVEEVQRLCGLLEQNLDRLDPASAKCIQPILETISLHNPIQLSTFLQRSIVQLQLSPPVSSLAFPSPEHANSRPGHAKILFRHLILTLLRNQSDPDLFSATGKDAGTTTSSSSSSFTILSALVNRALQSFTKDSHVYKLGQEARFFLEQASSEGALQVFDLDAIVDGVCCDMEQISRRCNELHEELCELETELYALLQTEKAVHEKLDERDRRMQRMSSSSRIKSIWSYIVGK
ncbi:glyceraldehyde-3-phosphate dehydrogenase 1 [Chytriomyces hyalinus]|nr:glyceraldehyde-3-phosphate dehydrogenase 1 [Chytriomyces hyalinus]